LGIIHYMDHIDFFIYDKILEHGSGETSREIIKEA